MRLRGIRCHGCNAHDLVSVSPGDAPERAPGNIVIATGTPAIGWCIVCAPRSRGYRPDRQPAVAE